MDAQKLSEQIQKAAMALDSALESRNTEEVLSYFADDCEIELLKQILIGKEGVKKWIDWLYKNLRQIKLQPIVMMVEGNKFFEEFIVRARLYSGIEVKSRQAEVLIYDDKGKIKSLRLYFDRLDFIESVTKGPISKTLVNQIIKKSLEGLA